ncbi:MAG: ArsA-related P-loop ATPase [Myxococcota bacterium]
MVGELHHKRLICITGKGGVGKSALTASVARLLHRQSAERRVLACEVEPCSALGPLLGLDAAALEHTPKPTPSGVWGCNIDPDRALIDITRRFVRSPTVARATVSNPFTRLFFKTAPFVAELATLLHLRQLLHRSDQPWDTVVFDLPSTGHATAFLTAPATAHGLLRVGGLAQLTGKLDAALRDPEHTAIILVTRPETMPINETIALYRQLQDDLGPVVHHVVINMVRPAPVDESERTTLNQLSAQIDAAHIPPHLTRLIEGGMRGLGQRDREQHQIDRLHTALEGIVTVTVPYIFGAHSDPDLVEQITDALVVGNHGLLSPST